MKSAISESRAAAMVMDSIFKQADLRWPELALPFNKMLGELGLRLTHPEYAKFHVTIAALAVNMRSLFDLFPQPRAVVVFDQHLEILKKFFPDPMQYKAVENTLAKYIEAYNEGIYHIRNPLQDVATYLYYKIGLENTEQKVVDENFYAPEPMIRDYLVNVLIMFTGKWDFLLERYEVEGLTGLAPDEDPEK